MERRRPTLGGRRTDASQGLDTSSLDGDDQIGGGVDSELAFEGTKDHRRHAGQTSDLGRLGGVHLLEPFEEFEPPASPELLDEPEHTCPDAGDRKGLLRWVGQIRSQVIQGPHRPAVRLGPEGPASLVRPHQVG